MSSKHLNLLGKIYTLTRGSHIFNVFEMAWESYLTLKEEIFSRNSRHNLKKIVLVKNIHFSLGINKCSKGLNGKL